MVGTRRWLSSSFTTRIIVARAGAQSVNSSRMPPTFPHLRVPQDPRTGSPPPPSSLPPLPADHRHFRPPLSLAPPPPSSLFLARSLSVSLPDALA